MKYKFDTLAPDDFERLVHDLLDRSQGLALEAFKGGKDQGIDLRHAPVHGRHGTVVQCKRYDYDDVAALIRKVEKDELPKIVKLRPSRYILATSAGLSAHNKKTIAKILGKYCINEGDILGCEDLNKVLRQFPSIEKSHFKLWLTSTTVLTRILNSSIYNRSQFEIDVIKQEISRFVPVQSLKRARGLLNKHHYCIIAGLPGIGKTTLAKILLANYAANGATIVSLSGDIEEAWKVSEQAQADPKKKFVFYYDDFLGQAALKDKLPKNEEVRLLAFMELCRRSSNMRFVLTTREYILEQAAAVYEKLDREKNKLVRCTIHIKELSTQIRAKILFNHLYFSDLPKAKLNALLKAKAYHEIISHNSFSPRIIDHICTAKNFSDVPPKEFAAAVIQELDDPKEVWRRPFSQLSESAQIACFVLLSLDGSIPIVTLDKCTRSTLGKLSSSPYQIRADLKILDGTFVQTSINESSGSLIVEFHNPSVAEFVALELSKRHSEIKLLIDTMLYVDQAHFFKYHQSATSKRLFKETILQEFPQDFFQAIVRCHLNRLTKSGTGYGRNAHVLEDISLLIDVAHEYRLRDNAVYEKTLLNWTAQLQSQHDSYDWRTILGLQSLLTEFDHLKAPTSTAEQNITNLAKKMIADFDVEDLDDSNCYRLADLIDDAKNLLSKEERKSVKDRLESRVEDLISECLEDSYRNSSEYESFLDTLERIETSTGFSFDSRKKELSSAIRDAKRNELDEKELDWETKKIEPTNSDRMKEKDIDSLFSLLSDY